MTVTITKASRVSKAARQKSNEARGGLAAMKGSARSVSPQWIALTDFVGVYKSPPELRVQLIRRGVRATEVKVLVEMMDVPQKLFFQQLKLSSATVNRKAMKDEELSAEDSERVIGMSNLIGQVQSMVNQSGNPEGFNAAKWLARWMEEPVSALGGERPADYMDTMEGQKLVSNLLSMMQSGAYA